MKIYDCFMYFDEDLVLDIRLNILDKFIDKFVIVESEYSHKGEKRETQFNIDKYKKFKDKIIYLKLNHEPKNIEVVNENDSEKEKNRKYIMNAAFRENYQRNYLMKGLKNANDNDYIIISDLDEIPNLENINFNMIKKKMFFQQIFFYYKLNLYVPSAKWCGSRACLKKNLISPQWLRNIKDKNYSSWRFDTLFSKTKYSNILFIENGGWHFAYLKSPKDIEKKLKSYLHHREYDLDPVGIEKIKEKIKLKKTIYDLKVDMRQSKFDKGQQLDKINIELLPKYIKNNIEKYKIWME